MSETTSVGGWPVRLGRDTSRPLTLATWNIGGGIVGASHQRGAKPSLSHYGSVLAAHRPDVVCLQEAHEYDGRPSQTQELAEMACYPYAASYPVSASHLLDGARLALGILSRFPLNGFTFRRLPAPQLEAAGPSDESWTLHDKGYVVGTLDVAGRGIGLVNGHFFPLHRFGASPTEPRFAAVWDQLTQDMLALSAAGPALAAFDLNHSPIGEVLDEALRPGRFVNAIGNTPTTPRGVQRDYVLHDHTTRVLETRVVPTESDHFYCQVSVLV